MGQQNGACSCFRKRIIIMSYIASIKKEALAQRLADARKACGLTQQEAANRLQVSRPTLISIEKGIRPVKPAELLAFASLYGRSVHDLVKPLDTIINLQPHLRAVANKIEPANRELEIAIERLQVFAEHYQELESILEAPMTHNYPPELQLSDRINVNNLAEDLAISERNRLGLGDQPVYELRRILEESVGLRIFYANLPSQIAGLYAYAGPLGCCISINRKHPTERQRASLAHEYGHVIVDRHKPGIDYLDHKGKKPLNERFAESFGMAFLMPVTSVRRRFTEILTATGDFNVADLCRLSSFFNVSVEAMTYRLEHLQLLPTGTMLHLRESHFEIGKAKAILNLPSGVEYNQAYPDRYVYLAVQAYEQARISESQLAKFLDVDVVKAREIVETVSQVTNVNENGEVENCRFDLPQSLLPGKS